MQGKPKIIFNLLLLLCLACSQKLVCYTKTKLQSETIYKYFGGVSQGFYIDLNPEQPIANSNTIYLKSQGWTGVNVLETYAKYSQFVNIRKGQINILGQIAQIKQGEKSKVKNVAPKINIQQICQNFVKKRLEVYFISVKHISTFVQSKIWEDQKCKSQLIFIRLNEVKQIQQIHNKNLASLGYSKVAQDESFILYVLTTQIPRYSQKLSQFQAFLSSNPLVPFSKILQPIKQQSLQAQSQLVGNKIGQRILVQFSKSGQNVDLHKLISQSKTDYIIVLEFDPRKSQFIVNQDYYQMEKVVYGDGIQFYHVVYRFQGKDKEYHIYVYDHERETVAQGQLRKNNIILQLGDLGNIQAHKYNMSQIQKYNIDNIKRINETTQTKSNQTQPQQQKQKRPSSKQQQLQKQIQHLKQKYRKQQQQQKQLEKAREQQKKQLERLKKQNKSNHSSSSNSSNETSEGQPKVAVKKPQKQDIAYLTPQTMFANKQVKNMTIVIIILIICIIGSIMLTAAITAYIMKRRHKRIIAARIKSNAEMAEMHAQGEQRTQDQQQGSAVFK